MLQSKNFVLYILATLIIFATIYLTKHYFEIRFSPSITTQGLCNINQFWSCDITSKSLFSDIFNIPTSVFGLFFGLLLFTLPFFPFLEYEKTIAFISAMNLFGCVGLFFYSIVALDGLCPICTVYYVLSLGVVLYFWRLKIGPWIPKIKILLILFACFSLVGCAFSYTVASQKAFIAEKEKSIIKEFNSFPKVPFEFSVPPIQLNAGVKDSPLELIIFSDFECQYCKDVAGRVEKIIHRYGDKVKVLYYPFPLDKSCNPAMKNEMHEFACDLAKAALCKEAEFKSLHDNIFENQQDINDEWVKEFIQKNNIELCMNDTMIANRLKALIQVGIDKSIEATPTIYLNRVKIQFPKSDLTLFLLLDQIIKTHAL